MVQRTCSCTKSHQGWVGGGGGVTTEHATPRNQCVSQCLQTACSAAQLQTVLQKNGSTAIGCTGAVRRISTPMMWPTESNLMSFTMSCHAAALQIVDEYCNNIELVRLRRLSGADTCALSTTDSPYHLQKWLYTGTPIGRLR